MTTEDRDGGNQPQPQPLSPVSPPITLDMSLRDIAAIALARDELVGLVNTVMLVYTWTDESGAPRKSFNSIGPDIPLLGLALWGLSEVEKLVAEGDVDDEGED